MSSTTAIETLQNRGSEPHPTRLVANVVELLEAARGQFERDREAAKASITRATSMLRSELQRHRVAEQSDCGTGKLAGWQVLRLRAYVDGHLSETIHVSDLSAIARRSTAHFCRAFKRTFGQTPHAYITAQRLERARQLMLQSEEQLSVIAVACGFTDQAHLSKLFRQHTGETPGGWRRRHAVDDQDESWAWALRA